MSTTTEELEKFVVECQSDLEAIKISLSAFNIFNVLGVQHREIRHSNFLGWLFDPNESHQLGDVFLKDLFKLLRKVGVLNPEQYIELLLEDLSATQVYRESVHNIDILIVNEELGFVICIENKINADFSIDQLKKYHKYVEVNYENLSNRMYLTLTPKPSNRHSQFCSGEFYTNINYKAITVLIENNKESINLALPTVKESINQYVTMVENDITHTSKEAILAKKIYKKYKKEIDFIFRNQDNFGLYKNEIIRFINDGNIEGFELSHDSGNKNFIFLLPTDNTLRSLFYYPEARSRGGDYIFSLVLYLDKDALWLKFGFGNIEESEKMEEIQVAKSKMFNAMKAFDCFKTKKLKVDLHPGKPEMDYPSICGVQLFHNEMYSEENSTVLSLFKINMDRVNRDIIQPWIKECLEKLKH